MSNLNYILTMEKFKSKMLSKIGVLLSNNPDFKEMLSYLTKENNISVDKLTDSYFEYLPATKVYKSLMVNSEGSKDKYRIGQVWQDSTGDIDTIEKIEIFKNGSGGDIIGKKYGTLTEFKFDEDGNMIQDYLVKLLKDVESDEDKSEGKNKNRSSKYRVNDKYIFFWFDIENHIVYTTKMVNGQHEVISGDRKFDNNKVDYVVVLDLKKAIKNLSSKDLKKLRKERTDGAFLSSEDIKNMNIDRYKKIIIDKYSEISPSKGDYIEKFIDYNKILKRAMLNNPLLFIISSDFIYLEGYRNIIFTIMDKVDNDLPIEDSINDLRKKVIKILDSQFVKKIDLTFSSGGDIYGDLGVFSEYLEIWMRDFYPLISEINKIISDSVENYEFTSLHELEIFMGKFTQIESLSTSNRYSLKNLYNIIKDYEHRGFNSDRYRFSYRFDEFLDVDSEEYQSELIAYKAMLSLVKSIF